MLTAANIAKAYGATRANDDVSFEVASGEIVGLVGENGAGKSTLLSILAGFIRPDAGALAVDGRAVAFASPADSLAAGIGLVHQHLSLVPTFTVREQLELAGWSSTALPETLANDFRGNEIIEQLSMGRRQRVEIARALIVEPRVLLLDEPTSILAPSEVGALFGSLRRLRESGIAIVIVTHKLREVMAMADRIVVMANGRTNGAFARADGEWAPDTGGEILRRMFAWDEDGLPPDGAASETTVADQAMGPPVLRVSGLNAPAGDGSRQLQGVEFDLASGCIHAIAGIAGQGQAELAEAIAGYGACDGRISLDGLDLQPLSAVNRAAHGVALLVDDRLGEAAIGSFSLAENLVLKRPRKAGLGRNGFFRRHLVTSHAQSLIDAWDIEPTDPNARLGSLSGGNMQRVLAAREIEREPRVLIALNPVQGLDVQTADLLWRRLRQLCNQGATVLVFTSDLDEAMAHGDRCAAIFDGRVSPFLEPTSADRRAFAAMMVNGW